MATTTEKHESCRLTSSPFNVLRIAPWGQAEVLVVGGGFAFGAMAMAFLSPWLAIPPAFVALFVAWFFRDPPRLIPGAPGLTVSPADGRVTHVQELVNAGFWDGPAIKISIYLSIFNVHVNRVPEAARVVEVRPVPGRRLNTRRAESAEVNEQCCTLFEGDGPTRLRFLVRQVAGPFASRVVCAAQAGDLLGRGDHFGMIKFGSRTDLLLSRVPSLRVLVRAGDRVKGASTVLARYDI
jgi:phosphatidylserine decarboxylase